MPPSKSKPTVFYARDKSPMEEHNGPRASIEGDEGEEEEEELIPKIKSDLVDYASFEEELNSPEPEKIEQDSKPEKRALSPGEESDEEATDAKAAPPAKRQRRSQVNSSAPPRRSKRVASTASLQDEDASGVDKEKPNTGKKRRGRPPAKTRVTKTEAVPKTSPPSRKKTLRGDSTIEWEVEKIIDSQVDADTKVLYYQVKWKGFGNKENTWEPKKNLGKCAKLIKDFENDQ
ncbi:Testis-specific chromodomain-containing protein [Fusarium pseudoanthophilum]|uniref:Testis-specific chromodomain-containing protein n=1 Tax=Fusarium pseudoanthophilum TaxID=48495 RepID=A0A8H5USZ0_9HYPO|nr:Testis-specific chromodomain-containing protein [Fusarium pseudoanthophilum]